MTGDGLFFDLVLWAPGMTLGLNLEDEDPRHAPTGPRGSVIATLGGDQFRLPPAPGSGLLQIVGGGTVSEGAFHYRFLAPVTRNLPDHLHLALSVPSIALQMQWRVDLATEEH